MSGVIELDSSEEDNDDVVEVSMQMSSKKLLNPVGSLANAQGLTKEFVMILNMCFNYENTEGMERIITRNLIPVCKNANKEYVESSYFKNFLTRIIKRLEKEPFRKYSCLKEISDNLKKNTLKKKVGFVTLDSHVSETFKRHFNRKYDKNHQEKKKKLNDVINLDENEDPHPQVIDLDKEIVLSKENTDIDNETNLPLEELNKGESCLEHHDEVILLDSQETTDDKCNDRELSNFEHRSENIDSTCNSATTNHEITKHGNNKFTEEINNQITCSNLSNTYNYTDLTASSTPNSLNVNNNYNESTGSHIEVASNDLLICKEKWNEREILITEGRIKVLKDRLRELEETEVCDNTATSPYLMCHKIKLLIVDLYKRICELRGEEYARKSRQLVLQVKEGHPEGPARMLEKWLNENKDEHGEPCFPDLHDVIRCVWAADYQYQLNWSGEQIYHEARLLFSQCGAYLQKRRQEREWRDLMHTAKREHVHLDPAETDPELMAKLEANRMLATSKFDQIVQHYAKMEETSRKKRASKIKEVRSKVAALRQAPSWDVPIDGTITIAPNLPNIPEIKTEIQSEAIQESNTVNCNITDATKESSEKVTGSNNNYVVKLVFFNGNWVRDNTIVDKTNSDSTSNSISESSNVNNNLSKANNSIFEDCNEEGLKAIKHSDSQNNLRSVDHFKMDLETGETQYVNNDIRSEKLLDENNKSANIEEQNKKQSLDQDKNQNGETLPNNNDDEVKNENELIIKKEIKTECDFTDEEFDMLFKSIDLSEAVTTTVFDVDETVVMIDILSSDDDSDDDDCQICS